MPFVFVIDGAGNQIRETWTGTVTADELRESCRQEWADPAYRRGMDMLSDFSAATLDVSHDELRRFAQFIGQQEAVRRHAIAVGRQVGYGVARMFGSLSEVSSPYWSSLRVFNSLEEAARWLAVDPPAPDGEAQHNPTG